jgi:hypothetical protein
MKVIWILFSGLALLVETSLFADDCARITAATAPAPVKKDPPRIPAPIKVKKRSKVESAATTREPDSFHFAEDSVYRKAFQTLGFADAEIDRAPISSADIEKKYQSEKKDLEKEWRESRSSAEDRRDALLKIKDLDAAYDLLKSKNYFGR